MNLKNLFTLNAILALFFGVGLVLAPSTVTSYYDLAADPGIIYAAQLYGSALILVAVLTWSVRALPDSEARRAILLSLFVGDSLQFITSLLGQMSGAVNALGWSTVALSFLLALGYGYFRFRPLKS